MIPDTAVNEFARTLRGELITPADAGYDRARTLYNAMIDKRPAMIARCVDVADVITAVRWARHHDLTTAVRGGGHNGPGFGSCDDGLVIDLSAMRGIRVDPEARTVRAEGGCTQGDVDHATHAFGLAIPAGIVSSTGIGGLTLGGGHGYLSRRYGLTIDNLLEADVVLADGSVVTASVDDHADLFWALRGGGGNFGIVTSFLFRAHPVSTIFGGPMFWPLDALPQIMKWYRGFLPQAPLELSVFLHMGAFPSADPFPPPLRGQKNCALVVCYTGPEEDAEEAVAPLRSDLPKPLIDMLGPMPMPALQTLFDPLLPPGLQWYWKGDFVRELPDEAINVHLEHIRRLPSELSIAHLYPIDGAVHDVASADTAWSCRDATWSLVIAGIDADPAHADALRTWARDYWKAIHPFNLPGAYINFMMEEGDQRIRATYGGNYARLAAVKKQYDPDNFFRINQNIPPA